MNHGFWGLFGTRFSVALINKLKKTKKAPHLIAVRTACLWTICLGLPDIARSEEFLQRDLTPAVELFADVHSQTGALWAAYLARPHPSVRTLKKYFHDAGREYRVPTALLKAIGQVETNWTHIGPSIDQGWGVMHLVQNDFCDSLGEASRLLGVDPQVLKDDARQNVRGAAALLRQYAGSASANSFEDWYAAAKRFTCLVDDETRELQVGEYYNALRTGRRTRTLWGEAVRIAGHSAVQVDRWIAYRTTRAQSTDYPAALLDLTPCSGNFGSGRNHSIDTWTNHWVGVGTYAGAISWFKTCRNPGTSSQFVVRASDGQITQVVRIADTAYHAGVIGYPYNNGRSIGVEHEATMTNPDLWNSAAMINASADMARYFADLYSIPKVRAIPGMRGHNEMPGASTDCPGNLPWTTWMNRLLGSSSNTPPNKPTNISPYDGQTGVSLTPTLHCSSFSDPDGNAHAQSWWEVRCCGCSGPALWDSTWRSYDLTSTVVPPGKLSYGGCYQWKCRYADNGAQIDGNLPWSQPAPVATTFYTSTCNCNSPGPCETASGATCSNGICVYPAATGQSCNDSNSCTTNDICTSGKQCVGTTITCNSPGFCEKASGATCSNGSCFYPAATGQSCNDSSSCTTNDVCTSGKQCVGTTIACNSPGFCETTSGATCSNGSCVYPAATGQSCNDSSSCTTNDVCTSGKQCVGTTIACNSPGFCETASGATCSNGSCFYPAATGQSCNDNNSCTTNDVCTSGKQCVGVTTCGSPSVTPTQTPTNTPLSSATRTLSRTPSPTITQTATGSPSTPVCGNGFVESGEQCDQGAATGTSSSCCGPSCSFKSSGTTCRVTAGPCDLAEACQGNSASCPIDAFASGTVCRLAAGACDVGELCSGASVACPADTFAPDGTGCPGGTCQSGVCIGRVPNDFCSSPLIVSATPYASIVETSAATVDADDPSPPCGSGQNSKSVWYRLTALSAGTITAETFGSSYDTVLSVYTGSCGALSSVVCNDDADGVVQSGVSFAAAGGTTYYFMVSAWSGDGGTLTFHVTFEAANQIPNLAPYQPPGWSAPIVVSNTSGTSTDTSLLSPGDGLYVDWAIVNTGTIATASVFYSELYLDAALIGTWFTQAPFGTSPNYTYIADYSIGTLQAGTHTLRIKTDSTSAITETDETDNEVTKVLLVIDWTPTSTPTRTATVGMTATRTQTRTFTPSPSGTATSTPTKSSTHTATPTNTPSSTATVTPSATSTRTLTGTATNSPTNTATRTRTTTPTDTPSSTPTRSPSETSSPTQTTTSTATKTSTAVPTSTATGTNTATQTTTSTPTSTATSTTTQTPTSTITRTPTASRTSTVTSTATYSSTITPTYTATASPSATPSSTPTPSPSETSSPTQTTTSTPTTTPTAVPTSTATGTSTATHTSTTTTTSTPTSTATPTTTQTPTSTISRTPTASQTSTVTSTATYTSTVTPTSTATNSPSDTPTQTPTGTPTATPTPSVTLSPTATATLTVTQTAKSTVTHTPTGTPSATTPSTNTPTATATPTVTRTVTPTSSATFTYIPSPSPTETASPSVTATPDASGTPTPTVFAGTLMGHIATDTTTIEVENISLFPTYGVIRIDQETMTYDGTESSAGVQALSITGVVQPGRLLNVRRGVRGAIVPHQAGAAVTLVRTCRGDCDISDDVSVADLSMMVQAALGMHPFAACIPGDSDGSHDITIEDIIAAANDASAECRVALVPTSQTARP